MSRRQVLRAGAAAAFAAGFGGIEAVRKAWDLYEQHATWAEASRPNSDFFAGHAADLARLSLGGSFSPEVWGDEAPRALRGLDLAVRELGVRQLRLGLRWSRIEARQGVIELAPYRPFLDYCFESRVELCLNVGPVRVFRYPEEHVPGWVFDGSAEKPAPGSIIDTEAALARSALAYADRLLEALKREYGASLGAVSSIQIENEPFFPLGPSRWRFRPDYLAALAGRVRAALPGAGLLVTSAGRLDLDFIRDLFASLRREGWPGRLVSGFDFHYKTPLRDSFPIIRHFDQVAYAVPFAPTLARHVWDSRDLGFEIEVSEGQAEPYGQFESPGNSARDFRFMILRCLDKVLDPERPALIRVWGIEYLTGRMLAGDLSEQHRDIIEIIQTVNGVPTAGERRPDA